MTDPTHSDDEIVSSYIDGEATLDEVVRVQADPELLAEVQEFETVAELVSTPVAPLPQSDVDELIGNALDQSSTSDRIADLAAVRAIRTFNPQRLAAVAAGVLLLAGVVGALIAINNAGTDAEMNASFADSSEMADDFASDDGDDMAFDSDMPAAGDDMGDDGDMAEAMPDSADMAEEYFEDESDDMDAGDDTAEADDGMAASDDFDPSLMEQLPEATTTVTAVDQRRSYSRLVLEIAESYETLGELIDHTADQWREVVATDFAGFIVTEDEEGYEPTEQALSAIPCGENLLAYIDRMPDIDGFYTVRISETTINGVPTSVAVLGTSSDLRPDYAALLTSNEPTCTVTQRATLSP